jgi:uncharacterized membrane protein
MSWHQRYLLRNYVRNSIWILPVIAMFGAVILVGLLHRLEDEMGWKSTVNSDTMRAVLSTLAGAMFTFIVFVCSSLLLVVQLASAQLTPRMIGILLRDRVTKLTLSMFVFTFAFSISALVRIGESVPRLTAQVAAYSSAACLGLFLYLIDNIGKLLRPSGALQTVAAHGHLVIDSVYPRRLKQSGPESREIIDVTKLEPSFVVVSSEVGVLLAFDIKGIVALGTRHDSLIEMVPRVGDFVARGNPLFRIYGNSNVPVDVLRGSVALGAERTVEQDPALAFRVVVDIASKGLSSAINDPTTAVLAIDRLHHLLRHVGNRRLDNAIVPDRAGRVRLLYSTPDWEDFVALAVTEIRQFGGSSIQIVRRLRAMLEDLLRYLPPDRAAPLQHELTVLQRSSRRLFQEPEDQALADIGDSQGVGGKEGRIQLDGRLKEAPFP